MFTFNPGLPTNNPELKLPTVDKFKTKYQRLKNSIHCLIYENAALCNQVSYLQEKILCIKEENNFLARKLKHFEFLKNASLAENGGTIDVSKKLKRKTPVGTNKDPAKAPKPAKIKRQNAKPKKTKESKESTSSASQFAYPLLLDNLSIQCLGTVIHDRINYHTESILYPVGYISTNVYGSIREPRQKCLYTCKILEDGLNPKFEILSDDGVMFSGSTPDECHRQIISMINKHFAVKLLNETIKCGEDFFGLSNTNVQYLISMMPEAKFTRFNIQKFKEQNAAKSEIMNEILACTRYEYLVKRLPTSCAVEPCIADPWLG